MDDSLPETMWFIPNHGVCHCKKSMKIRVVFDGLTRYDVRLQRLLADRLFSKASSDPNVSHGENVPSILGQMGK